jgi:GNAT superfamily N-acetyltransferase
MIPGTETSVNNLCVIKKSNSRFASTMGVDAILQDGTSAVRSALTGEAPDVELSELQPARDELDRINRIVAAAIGTWDLPERVTRISIPLYHYHESDLPHMRFVVACPVGSGEIIGLAAVEDADPAEGPARGAMLLHGIYVDPRHHRGGIGSTLLAAAEKVAASNDASGLLVKAQPDAVPFFEASGYEKLPVSDRARDYEHRFWKPLFT